MNFKEHIERDKNLNLIKDQTLHLEIESYLVGGYVRDILISRDCKDIDIMTIGEPFKLVENISKKKGFSDFKIFKNFSIIFISFIIIVIMSMIISMR